MGVISAAGHSLARTGLAPLLPTNDAAWAAPAAVLPLRSVVVMTDLSKAGTHAAWRAGIVARDRKLPLHILGLSSVRGNADGTQAELDKLARALRDRLLIPVSAQAVRGDLLREGAQAAREAELLVIAAPRSRPLVDWLLGTSAERLARRRTPVLVVRRPAFTSYRRVVVPVALEGASWSQVAAARALSRDPAMKVLNVLPTDHEDAMRLADVPERTILSERQRAAQKARGALLELIAAAGAHDDCAEPAISFGHAPTRVLEQERASGADLLVLGQRPRRSLVDLLPGGVARRVLRATQADVLLVPLRRRAGRPGRFRPRALDDVPRLDPRALPAASVALTCAVREVARLADMVELMLRGVLQVFLRDDDALARSVRDMDDAVHDCHGELTHYLAAVRGERLSADEERRWNESMAFTTVLGQVADTMERVLRDLDTRAPASRGHFSPAAIAEVCSLHTLLLHDMRLAVNLLLERDAGLARSLVAAGRAFAGLKQDYVAAHLERVAQGDAGSVAFNAVYLDLLAHLERTNSLVCSLAARYLPSRPGRMTGVPHGHHAELH